MKTSAVIRDICGTYAGWKRHKYHNEEGCQPCRDSNNEYRRKYRVQNPEKGKEQAARYLAKPGVVEKRRAANLEHRQRVANSVETLEARAAKAEEVSRLRREALEAVLAAKEQKAEDARLAREAILEEKRRVAAISREQYWEATHMRRVIQRARIEVAQGVAAVQRAKAKELRDQAREVAQKAQQVVREAARLARATRGIEHGTTYGEYSRCVDQPEGSCESCKAAASAYMRTRRVAKPELVRSTENAYRKAHPEGVRDVHRRAANRTKRGFDAERQVPYTRRGILERDDYTCYLCNEKVDLNAPHQAGELGWERFPHLDHEIPLAKGGADSPDNVRTTHAKCNLDKGSRLLPSSVTSE